MTEGRIRKPAFAGSFYPAERSELESVVSSCLDTGSLDFIGEVHGLIVPHAGYQYSGGVAGAGYAGIDIERFSTFDMVTVFLLGPAHRLPVQGIAVSGASAWETPLGEVRVSPLAAKLSESPLCSVDDPAHDAEHSLEVQLPFLQKCLGENSFEIVPILMTDADPVAVAGIIEPHLGENAILCVSTDLSHYLPYEQAKVVDRLTIDSIRTFNFAHIGEENVACGLLPVLSAMHIARERHWKFTEVMYRNSGDITGEKDAVVGYVSILMGTENDE